MARTAERVTLLSRDLANSIRYFCFGNISEFYRRYKAELSMSRATFYRVLSGEYATPENVTAVELLSTRLGLIDKDGGSSYLVKGRVFPLLLNLLDRIVAPGTSMEILSTLITELRTFLKDNRKALLS